MMSPRRGLSHSWWFVFYNYSAPRGAGVGKACGIIAERCREGSRGIHPMDRRASGCASRSDA